MTPDFSYLASLAVYIFGAVTLAVLTASYWRHHRRSRSHVPAVFALVCAVAFVNNLLYQADIFQGGAAVVLIRNAAAGLLPALILHLVIEFISSGWRRVLAAFYIVCAGASGARVLDETGLVSISDGGALYFVPAVLLATASLLGILVLMKPDRPLRAIELAHRRALLIVLAPMLLCAIANFDEPGSFLRQAPDYLVLSFFCVTLYFRERLAFIDLLVKRGTFFALGLVILAGWLMVEAPSAYATGALVLMLWLAGPAVYARIDRLIDSVWLRRPYAPADAERQFIREIQAAGTEEELRQLAARGLSEIFRASAEVRFQPPPLPEEDETLAVSAEGFSIVVEPRADGIPFLSDDRRLLQSLAGALSVILENVHFREREQQLRWLASRAQLKALRAQINPHFLFNALSVITGLVQYHPERAAETIEELAQVFRYALRKSENEWAPLGEEVEFVTAYLRVEQARFGERLKVDLHVDPAVSRIPIPAMSIQPLIENAIKHGISGQENGGVVGLRAAFQGDLVSVEVFDSGPGFPPNFILENDGEAHGLRNVMERVRGYYGDAAGLRWESGSNGTRVILTVPRSGKDTSDTRSDRR